MHRQEIQNIGLDHRIFTRTARQTKKINVAPRIQRGGIRL